VTWVAECLMRLWVAVLHDQELLLVLDNFEHGLEAAPLVGRLLASCPRLSVLCALMLAAAACGVADTLILPARKVPRADIHLPGGEPALL
jgi:hypothetical protein